MTTDRIVSALHHEKQTLTIQLEAWKDWGAKTLAAAGVKEPHRLTGPAMRRLLAKLAALGAETEGWVAS